MSEFPADAACTRVIRGLNVPNKAEVLRWFFGEHQLSDDGQDVVVVHTPEDIVSAKIVCSTCPVTEECLERGTNEPFGIWGGLTGEERGHAQA